MIDSFYHSFSLKTLEKSLYTGFYICKNRGEKMVEVKEIKSMEYLPRVFLTPDLNKHATVKDYINCAQYCLKAYVFPDKIKVDTIRETKGIYFTPHPPIITTEFRQRVLRTFNDVKEVLSSLDFSKVSLKSLWVLVKYHDYNFEIYDIHKKGKMYEFPMLVQQGNLKVYQTPPIRDAYLIYYENGQQKKELNRDLFDKVNETILYNHKISFNNSVLIYKNLFITPGNGMLIYAPENTNVKLASPDHKEVEFNINKDTWVLFSHPRPHNGKD